MHESTSHAEVSRPVSANAFERFLKWLDNGSVSDGDSYLVMQKRLVAYFERKNCSDPDELADDTLARVARRLDQEGDIKADAPAQYCYIVARYVFLEHLRSKEARTISLDDPSANLIAGGLTSAEPDDESELREKLLTCLEKCTAELGYENKEMIIGYYQGNERTKINNRRSIASKLGISMNALSIRTCRIRDKLEACVKKCAG